VPIYEIVGLKEDVTDRTRECLGVFSEGMERYFACDFEGAIARFKCSAELEPRMPGRDPGVVSKSFTGLHRRRRHFRDDPPPENWDGVYEMKEK